MKKCSLCERAHLAKGLCSRHYYLANAGKNRARRPKNRTCSECGEKHFALGYCRLHYYRNTLARGPRKPPEPCRICGAKHFSKGLCKRHYSHEQEGRKPLASYGMTIEEKFHHYTDKSGDCWLWTAATYGNRYGAFYDGNRTLGAHRYSYRLHKGPIPDGMLVCHSCDNPRCVNPDHLFLGTPKDNMADKERKGRGNYPRGSTHHRAKLSDADVAEIRRLAGSMTQRAIAQKFAVTPSHISRLLSGHKRGRGHSLNS
jgi:hypothetical protein